MLKSATMPTGLVLRELYQPVTEPLAEVRKEVSGLWRQALTLVHGEDLESWSTGGKLLRPALCLLSAGAAGARDLKRLVPVATAMELLHVAALVHDDVLDSATLRRGQVSLNSRWDNHAAVLGGDYLVARAIRLLASTGNCGVVSNAIESVREMAEGELFYFAEGRVHATEASCLRLARKKTASLFAVTCSTPALMTTAAYRDALWDYGMDLGVAFQVVDDLLDLIQDEDEMGKPACNDVMEGKRTLPLLLLRESLDSRGRARLDSLAGRPLDDADRLWIAGELERSGARARTEELAEAYRAKAQAALSPLPESVYKDSMTALADFVVRRGS